jgi:hypothetical protein
MLMASAGRSSTSVPVVGVVPGDASPDANIDAEHRHRSLSLDLDYAPSPDSRLRVSIRQADGSADNIGAGGVALAETGLSTQSGSGEIRATFRAAAGAFTYEGGSVLTTSDYRAQAHSTQLGVNIVGAVQMGGAAIAYSSTGRTQWVTKHVMRSTSPRAWSAGVMLTRSTHAALDRPNPFGQLFFASIDDYSRAGRGEGTGVLFTTRGETRVQYASTVVSPFLQATVWRRSRLDVQTGLRLDHQSGFGTIVSPRISMGANVAGFRIGAGAGVFARSLPDAVVVRSLAWDGRQAARFIASDVSFADLETVTGVELPTVRSRLDADIQRPLELMQRVSVERVFGRFVPAVEYTWSRNYHALGSNRVAEDGQWVDVVQSNRAAERHRLRAQLRYGWWRHQLAAHYEWVRARDNADGPWSFPEQPGRVDAEWAPSSGVAPHNVTVMAAFLLRGGLSLNVTDTWNQGARYNITSGRDAMGNGLYVDRGGLPRNRGTLPGVHDLSLYAFRRFALPAVLVPGPAHVHVNVGVQARNMLDNESYTTIGAVMASPAFGRPLAALPGRSVRLFLTFD